MSNSRIPPIRALLASDKQGHEPDLSSSSSQKKKADPQPPAGLARRSSLDAATSSTSTYRTAVPTKPPATDSRQRDSIIVAKPHKREHET
jgi:hypothetical protein